MHALNLFLKRYFSVVFEISHHANAKEDKDPVGR